MTRRRLAAATIGALLLAASGRAPAEEKTAPAPASSSGSMPQANVPVVAVSQKPDLKVSFEGSGPGLPTGFTVRNIGNADSKLCVLKVTAAWVPPPAGSGGGSGGASGNSGNCPGFFTPAQCEGFNSLFGGSPEPSSDKMKTACGSPFPEVVEAVPVLKPGESKTFTRDTGQFHVVLPGNYANPVVPQATHVKQCAPTLVCAWDVTAVVDASNDNDERNKANNTATRRCLREVSFK